ncbi:MAG: tRNA (adenosine(37)-N6)-dimethylallyltransferase MiaA [Saprospiraceae bacterium]
MKTLIVISGPTASGKTSLGIRLAQKYDTEIISADSRQFYKEMNIGTAKPNQEELAAAKHHLIGHINIQKAYNAGDYEQEVLTLLEGLFKKKDIVILVGGSGLFIKALLEGLDEFPDVSQELVNQVEDDWRSKGLSFLQEELKEKDPVYYKQVDLDNPMRIIRALSVIRASGKTFSSFRTGKKKERPFESIHISLEWNREELYKRINKRVDLMLEAGLMEEVKKLHPFKNLKSLQTVGYQEFFSYLDNEYDFEEAIRLVKRNSRRYAKRQITWFKKMDDVQYFHPSQWEELSAFVENKIMA